MVLRWGVGGVGGGGVCVPSNGRGAIKDQHWDRKSPRDMTENMLESSAEVLLLGSEAMKPQDCRGKLLLKKNY